MRGFLALRIAYCTNWIRILENWEWQRWADASEESQTARIGVRNSEELRSAQMGRRIASCTDGEHIILGIASGTDGKNWR